MQSREGSTDRSATSTARPSRRRGARAIVRRSRVFVLGRDRRRSDDWDVRALRLPAPLLTSAPPPPPAEPDEELIDDLQDTAEWPERPARSPGTRSIDISDGPKLIHRPDPTPNPEAKAGKQDTAPPVTGTAAGTAPTTSPGGRVSPTASSWRTAETPFPPKRRGEVKPAVTVTADPASVQVDTSAGELVPLAGDHPEPASARSRGAVGGRTELPDPVRFLTEAPRTAEAMLAAVLCIVAILLTRTAGAPAAALVPLSAIPLIGLLALALPGGPAARTARAAALLTAGATLAALNPDLAPLALLTAIAVTVAHPAAGRAVTLLAALSLIAPIISPTAGGRPVLLLAGVLIVFLLGAHALRLQQALVRAVTVALARDHSARAAADRLEHARGHDAATGLATRDALLREITVALERRSAAGVVVLEIERFGAIADHHGAVIADQVAAAVGQRLIELDGNAARLARAQFAVPLRDASPDRCAETARALAGLLETPVALLDREIVVTAAIGAALASPSLCTATDLLQGAEEAARAARACGTARWTLFDPSLRAAAQARVALEEALRDAVRNGDIDAVYQPVLALGTGQEGDNCGDDRIVGAEALPRWLRADGTEVEVARFLPLAEDLGLSAELGLRLVDQALDALVTWRHEGIGVDQVWVNVPPVALRDAGFAHELAASLAVRGLPSSSIVIEISSSTIGDGESELATLGLLRSLGIAIALDDLGASGPSLAALRKLPVSAVKLDRTLTTELDRNDAVPRGIAQLCRSLGLRVVLTGVETLDQLDGARRIVADAAQGHAIARPLSAEDVTNLLTLRLPKEFRLS